MTARALLAGGLAAVLTLSACGGSTTTSTAGSAGRTQPARHHGHRASSAPARAVPSLIPPASVAPAAVQVPVLTYHRVAPLSAVGLTDLKVDPQNFVAELAALQRGGYHTITEAQLFDALYHHAALPPRPVLISVDDGYIDDVTTILPALQRARMVATFFVITGRMAVPGFLDADQIRQLDRAGMDVGDHTAHHVDLTQLTPAQLRMETAGSRAVLEHVLGHPVYFFAYPFGSHNDRVIAAVHAAGFTLAYTTSAGITESTASPLTLPRIHVGRALTPSGLLATLGGV